MRALSILAITLTGATLAGTSAQARSSQAASAYVGNTLDVRSHEGHLQFMMSADGTFKASYPEGRRFSGDWLSDGRYMCWITKVPPSNPGENFRCEQLAAGKKVGETWTHIDIYGKPATLTLLAGDKLGAR